MTMRQQLEQAGFTDLQKVDDRWYACTDPNGEPCAVLKQDEGRWHWFHATYEWTASGCSPDTCYKGGLGDAIDDDPSMNAYKRLLRNPPKSIRSYSGVHAAMRQVYHDNA